MVDDLVLIVRQTALDVLFYSIVFVFSMGKFDWNIQKNLKITPTKQNISASLLSF